MLSEKVILIVDDDLTMLDMYVERIKAEGAIVVTARNGQEALDQIRENKPAMILLDVMMPKLNGLEVLKQLRSDPETSELPVVLLTALADDKTRRQGMDLGAADYIVKSETLPIDVIEKIRKVIAPSDSGGID